ncbi:MAG: hypothetical protein V4502_06130 [Pseudomonadota bacterium]
MTVRELNDEIVNFLARNPQPALIVARHISGRFPPRGTVQKPDIYEVLHAIRDMQAGGWIVEACGKLYLNRGVPPEGEAA